MLQKIGFWEIDAGTIADNEIVRIAKTLMLRAFHFGRARPSKENSIIFCSYRRVCYIPLSAVAKHRPHTIRMT